MEYSVLKGTHDVIKDEADAYSAIESLLTTCATNYGFREFRTPIIEKTELFVRTSGESSDIVRKEMYDFKDKGDRNISLRPEVTAGTIRAMINAKLFAIQDFPIKAYYVGPNFRYERPQQGRFRQFNQFGVESVGSDSYINDVEVIVLGFTALKMLGFKNLKFKINTLGDLESRKKYKEALVSYFSKYIDNMCLDCKERINLNPLRILDCKVESDIEIIKGAPKLKDYLNSKSTERFENVLKLLKDNEIDYEVDDTLVRGLDYYSETVFEFHYVSDLGKNYGAIGAGGHYSELVEQLGGPKLSGVGFACGIERLYSILADNNNLPDLSSLDVYIMTMKPDFNEAAFGLVTSLRNCGFSADMNVENGSFSSMFKKAERRNAKLAIIIGQNEIENSVVQLKNLHTKEQFEVKLDDLTEKIDEILEEFEDHDHHHHHEQQE
ncbi:MAG: histidine--tRNA ligase [Bacilli bacterium]